MKPSHPSIRRLFLFLPVIASCLGLTGCKETKELQAELDAVNARIEKIKTDSAAQEPQLLAMRRAMPAASTPEEAAKRVMNLAKLDLEKLQAELQKAVTNYTQAEAEQKSLQKELEALRAQLRN